MMQAAVGMSAPPVFFMGGTALAGIDKTPLMCYSGKSYLPLRGVKTMRKPAVNIDKIEAEHPGIQLEDGIRGLTWEQVNEVIYAHEGELYFRKGVRADIRVSEWGRQTRAGYLHIGILGKHGVLQHRLSFFYHNGWLPEGDRKKMKPGNVRYVIHHTCGQRHQTNIYLLRCITEQDNNNSKNRLSPGYLVFSGQLQAYYDPELLSRVRSESMKGRVISEEGRSNMSKGHKGKKLSREHCESIRKAQQRPDVKEKRRVTMNAKYPNGYKHSEEMKQKIRAQKLGVQRSAETIRKMSEGHKGQVPWNKEKTGLFSHSDETKQKMRKRMMGNTYGLGVPQSEENNRKKRWDSAEKRWPRIKSDYKAAWATGDEQEVLKVARKWHQAWKSRIRLQPYPDCLGVPEGNAKRRAGIREAARIRRWDRIRADYAAAWATGDEIEVVKVARKWLKAWRWRERTRRHCYNKDPIEVV